MMKEQQADSWEALNERISRGSVPPLIWMHGEDEGRGKAVLEQLRERLVPSGARALNEASLDGREVSMERVLEIARSLPMLSKYRLVVLHNASEMKKGELEKAISYFQRPCRTTCLVIWSRKPPAPASVAAAVRENGANLLLRPRTVAEAQAWVRQRVSQEGKRITAQAVRAVVERAGTLEASLENEIQKLLAFVGEEQLIQEAHVRDVAAEVRTHALYELTQAMGEHKHQEAMEVLHKALQGGKSPLALMGMLAVHMRLLCAAVDSTSSGAASPRPDVQAFVWERLLKQARSWDRARVLGALRGLLEVDAMLKSGKLDPELLLDRWILTICGQKAFRSA